MSELPPLPEPDERTRKGLAFSGFKMHDYARTAIAQAREADLAVMRTALEALENLIKRIEINGGIGAYKDGPVFVMRDAHAAIEQLRKATGGQP